MQDFVFDPNPTAVFHAVKELGTPEYVKSAHVLKPADLRDLPDQAFADSVGRRFPVHTKAACWLSAAQWFGNGGADARVTEAIKTAAAAHDVSDEIKAIIDLFASTKEASAPRESRHALTVDFQGAHGLEKQSFYPLDDAFAIVESSNAIDRDMRDGRLPREFAQVACRALVKAAREHAVDDDLLSPKVVGIGEERWPDFDNLRHELGRRKQAGVTNLDDYQAIVDGAEAEFRMAGYDDKLDCLDKWASLWLDMDAANDIRHGREYMDPFTALFSGEKLASIDDKAKSSVFIDDVMVPGPEIWLLSENRIKAAFSKEAAEIVLAARAMGTGTFDAGYHTTEKLATLDADDRKELLRLLLEA